MKKCTKCFEVLPRTEFYVKDKGKSISAKCKKCTCEDHKNKRLSKKELTENDILYKDSLKRCSCCEAIKSLSEFYPKRNKFEAQCKLCKNTKIKKHRENPDVAERDKQTRKARFENNPEAYGKMIQSSRDYYANNKEKHKKACYAWYKRNKAKSAQYYRKWRLANLDISTYHAQKRRAQRIKATPKWAEQEDWLIRDLYRRSKEMSSGDYSYNVDHIVPLQSEFVCGLHCLANLEIIESSSNFQKGNRWWPDMWE